MKMQDFQCDDCGHEEEHLIRKSEQQYFLCPNCLIILRPILKATAKVIADDVPGGFTVENLSPTPETFYSKSAWRARMKELGMVNMVRHVGEKGSDRSKHTSRWV